MKHGKNPTVAQKKRIAGYNLNSENWLIIKDCADVFMIKHRTSGKVKNFENIKWYWGELKWKSW